MDEFVFRHSAGTGSPTIPTEPFLSSSNSYEEIFSVWSKIYSKAMFSLSGRVDRRPIFTCSSPWADSSPSLDSITLLEQWYHFKAKRLSDGLHLYLNGHEWASTSMTGGTTRSYPIDEIRVGGSGKYGEYLVDEFIFRASSKNDTPEVPFSPYSLKERSNAPVTRAVWTCANLPEGLSLSTDGKLSGRPITSGTYTSTMHVTTNWGNTEKIINIRVQE